RSRHEYQSPSGSHGPQTNRDHRRLLSRGSLERSQSVGSLDRMITPEVHYDLPDADYRAAPGVSNSMLKRLRERWSPAHAKATLAKPADPSAAMMFGKAFHWLILTPDAPCPFKVMPEGQNGRTKEGKAFIESTLAAGLDVLTQDQERRLMLTDQALSKHNLAASALSEGESEVSVFAPFSLGGT